MRTRGVNFDTVRGGIVIQQAAERPKPRFTGQYALNTDFTRALFS